MLPLRGLNVADFGQGVAGPYGAMLLGDFGADVVKIEPPRGDWGRTLGTRIGATESATFVAVNRNKRSIAIDLTTSDGVDVARDLVDKADVVVQSFRPGVMARYGLDYATLSIDRPRLIYCSVSGFGPTGAAANLPAGDSTMQAWGGLMSIVGSADQEPTRVGNVVSDMLAGMNAFQGILLAVLQRNLTGRGGEVEIALLDSLIAFQAPAFAEFLATGVAPPRTGNDHPLLAPSGLFKTADSPVVFSVLDHQWPAFCTFFGMPELSEDARFATNPDRLANREALMQILRPLFASESSQEVLRRLRSCDVPCAPVNDYAGVAADSQVRLNGLLDRVRHPQLGAVPFVRNPIRSRAMEPERGHIPLLGQHTDEILREAGYSNERLSALRAAKAIQ
jgi:crotonobetainyl-CoA:carnitine CoA-transferase CaiB-like acyl-CoA transferase